MSSNEARIAIVSDVHGSLTALEAVIADLRRTSLDLVVQAVDLALMGPQPEVIDRVREISASAMERPGLEPGTPQSCASSGLRPRNPCQSCDFGQEITIDDSSQSAGLAWRLWG